MDGSLNISLLLIYGFLKGNILAATILLNLSKQSKDVNIDAYITLCEQPSFSFAFFAFLNLNVPKGMAH